MVLKKIIIIVVLVAVILGGGYTIMNMDQAKKVAALEMADIDMSKVKDGTYTGDATTGIVEVEVEVTVKDGQISNIELVKHIHGLGGEAETMLPNMIQNNTYEVDTVSGATISSNAIKSAVSVALKKGMNN